MVIVFMGRFPIYLSHTARRITESVIIQAAFYAIFPRGETMNPEPITLLQQREIEAKIVAPLFRAFAAEVGLERAKEILAGVVEKLARASGCLAAQNAGGNGLQDLCQKIENWRAGNALTLEVLRRDEEALEFNVTHCKFAEMYRRLGLEELGPILSCNRDASMIEGFNSSIEFLRTQTLMHGASHCDFRYSKSKDDLPTDGT
jgi:hypothetical protein